jgi:hypothetical protein
MAKTSSEAAIRQYLNYLQDPASLRNDAKIAKLQDEVKNNKDPIARLRAVSALERAQEVDGSEAREAFVAVAKQWADREGISAQSFRELGVPSADLAAAGFAVRGRRPARPNTRGRTRTRARRRARRVPVADITAAVGGVRKRFTVRDLEAASGGTNATVRKALSQMVAEGVVVDLGPDPSWSGRGRSPRLYERR